jgi:hypothetical protein
MVIKKNSIRILILSVSLIISFMFGYFLRARLESLPRSRDYFGGIRFDARQYPSLVSLSPNERFRVVVIERAAEFGDRYFKVLLQESQTRSTTQILLSSEEGKPVGTERVVWKSDSSQFMIVGRKYMAYTHIPIEARKELDLDKFTLKNGDSIYMIYDVVAHRLHCPIVYQKGCLPIPIDTLKDKKWLNLE